MGLKTDIRGMVWKYPDTFVGGRKQVRQYATATKVVDPASHDEEAAAALGHDSLVAPLTFVSILANLIQRHFFQHVDVGLETMQIVQVDERFGADIVVTRNVCTNEAGEMVLEAYTTMMGHEGDNSISVKWDPESGQVMRKAVGE